MPWCRGCSICCASNLGDKLRVQAAALQRLRPGSGAPYGVLVGTPSTNPGAHGGVVRLMLDAVNRGGGIGDPSVHGTHALVIRSYSDP